MKVIAKIDNERVLCEVSRGELANLNGFRHPFDKNCDMEKLMRVGNECEIQKMVSTSSFIRSLPDATLKKIQSDLKSTLDTLEKTIETAHSLTLFKKLDDEPMV